ncbi:MAG TPA: hypothetical protein VHY35_10390 [Stellaceae bacterium]|nr:hypothetical protein [Stellaceae bacterium]
MKAAFWVTIISAFTFALPVQAQEKPPVVGNEATLRDFMVQNVCLNASGTVVSDVAPIQNDPRCVTQRDLRLGEKLPYHKHDHPSPDQVNENALGYQRHDSFPVATAGFPSAVEHSFDFGVGEERRFGVFDTGSDGGDLAVLSPGTVAMGVTEDGGAGFQLFVGECSGAVEASALTHGWIVAQYDPAGNAPLDGSTIARLNNLTTGRQDACPARFNAAYTQWHVAPFRFRAVPSQGDPITLTTLISEHYGGTNRATADHVERFYFTRELGGTRWERWQNAAGDAQFSAAKIAETAAWFAHTGRCSAAPPPEGGATMLLVDCREWTLIAPPSDPNGDPPGFFLKAVRTRADMPAFLAAPVSGR